MRSLFLTILLFIPIIGFGQNTTVRGMIMDEKSNKPLSYVNITLMKVSDSTLVKGALSEADGSFEINRIDYGEYYLRVLYTGYDTWLSEAFTLSRENNKKEFENIVIGPVANLLEAAVVQAEKPLFEMKHGTLTMNVDANPTTTGDNVLELLKKMPSVLVDQNDNISIEGKSGVTILVDDKSTYLSGEDLIGYLKSMPSNTVDRIEVMKKPSARYDAQGSGGVINIITKKEAKFGINGSVYAGLGYSKNLRTNEGFTLTARTGKFVFTGNYSYYGQKSSNSSQSETGYFRGTDTMKTTYNEFDEEKWGSLSTWQGHNFSFGTDYFINKKNVVGVFYRGNIGNSTSHGESRHRIYTNSIIDSSSLSSSEGFYKSQNHTLNLNYTHSFDSTGKDLHIDLIYSNNSRKSNRDNQLKYFTGNFWEEYRSEKLQSISDPSKTNVFTFKMDYEHPINDDIKVETGIKSSYVKNENFNENFRDDVLWVAMRNHFVYEENINAAYVIFSATLDDKLDIQLGLRAEHTYHKGELLTTGESNSQNYFNLFPNVSISYQFPKKHALEFGYRHSTYRPGYYELNPFVNVSDPYHWRTGNPQLKPDYSHSLDVSYSWNHQIFLWGGYYYTLDDYEYMTYTDANTGIRLERPENIGKIHAGSIGASARFTIKKFWTMNYYIGENFGQQQFDYRDQLVKKFVYGGWYSFNQTFTFLKNYSIEISGWGNMPSEETFGKSVGRFFLNAGVKANFFKNTFTVRLSVNDILNNGFWKQDYTYPDGSFEKGEYRWESRSVWLSLSYRFGKQDIQTRQRRSDNDILDRVGGGGNSGGGKGS